MKPRRRFVAAAPLVALVLPVAAAAAPAAPASPRGPSAAIGAAAPPAGVADASVDRYRRGVANVEREGRLIAVGIVLAGDGRVLTALSGLGDQDGADLRYADGTTVHARVGHRDRTWDLALLVPSTGKWVEGVQPSDADPVGVELRILAPTRAPRTLAPAAVQLRGRLDARSKEGEALGGVFDLDLKGAAPAPGAPILDPEGHVAGVLVRACRPATLGATDVLAAAPPPSSIAEAPACAPVIVGVPIGAIRRFLARTPADAVPPPPFLGIVGAPDVSGTVKGVRVMAVAAESPAAKAGLHAPAAAPAGAEPDRAKADLIVAVDGQPIETPEQLAALLSKHSPGESVKLLVFGGDRFRELGVVLRAAH